ncbi:MAG: S41 family peptidase [Chitinispirillaceae bacterium]|nr:S41 family peptidase [Chitinispirillaceae bacterium]
MFNIKKIVFYIVISLFSGCNITSFDSIYDDYIEFESVWQYLNAYSIYCDRLKEDAFSYKTIEEMMVSLGDTLYTKRYTKYIDNNDYDVLSGKIKDRLTYGKIENLTVFLDTVTDSTVTIKITSFLMGVTYNEFTEAVRQISNFTNIIVDLRGNGGGDIEETIKIINEFIPKDKPFIMARERVYDREKREAKTLDWHPWMTEETMNPILSSKKIVVLMDGNTASASEIMIAALKDCRDAQLVGNRSYGKGIGQIKIQRRHRLGIQTTFVQFRGISERIGSYHGRGIEPDKETLDFSLQKRRYGDLNDETLIAALKLVEPNFKKIRNFKGREYKISTIGAYKTIFVEDYNK